MTGRGSGVQAGKGQKGGGQGGKTWLLDNRRFSLGRKLAKCNLDKGDKEGHGQKAAQSHLGVRLHCL